MEVLKKKMLGSGATIGAGTTTLIISNDEMNEIIKIIEGEVTATDKYSEHSSIIGPAWLNG